MTIPAMLFLIVLLLLFGVPIFYASKWLARIFTSQTKRVKIATWTLTVILTPVCLLLAAYALLYMLLHDPSKDFDREEWAKGGTEQYQMADDLIVKKILIGVDTSGVKNFMRNEPYRKSDTTWTYFIGSGAGFSFTDHFLEIKFNNGKVVSIAHTWHGG